MADAISCSAGLSKSLRTQIFRSLFEVSTKLLPKRFFRGRALSELLQSCGYTRSGDASRVESFLKPRVLANVALLVCSIIWGITFVVVQRALADASVFPFLAARFTLAALVMGTISVTDLRKLSKLQIWRGVLIGMLMFGGYVFQTVGLLYTTPSKAAFITGFSIVLVPSFMALFWKSQTNTWVLAGALSSLAGLYYLTVPTNGFAGIDSGGLLVMVCAVSFAFHIIFIGRYSAKFSVKALSFLQLATTAILSLATLPLLAALSRKSLRFHLTGDLGVAILATAVLATALAFSLQVWAQRRTTASSTALILGLEPFFAAVTSFFVLRERLGTRALLGAALILAGIVVVELKGPTPVAVESLSFAPREPNRS